MQQDVQEHQQRAERIEALIQEVSAFPDSQARATTEELLQLLLDMYGEGIARMLALTAQTEASGQTLIETFASDELVSSLFLLHGLHPLPLEKRIAQALVEVRPYLKSHGGNVELVRFEDGVAFLRLEGSCSGCSASTGALKQVIEEAVMRVAPDLDGLQMVDTTEVARAMPVKFVPRRQKDSARPVPVAGSANSNGAR